MTHPLSCGSSFSLPDSVRSFADRDLDRDLSQARTLRSDVPISVATDAAFAEIAARIAALPAFESDGLSPYPRSSDVSSGYSPRWNVSVFEYPDGSAEGLITPVYERGVRRTPSEMRQRAISRLSSAQLSAVSLVGVDAVLAELDADPEAQAAAAAKRVLNDARAVQRAKVAVRRCIRSRDLRRLLTFTNGAAGDGWASRKAALDDVAKFLDYHGRETLHGRPAVLIAERGGKNGRWHVHAAIPGGYRLHYSKCIRKWSHFMEARGWHSPTGVHRWHAGDECARHKGQFASARLLARYMVKYMTKGFADEPGALGEHRYRLYRCEPPKAWRCTSPSVLAARVLLSVGDTELHARFTPLPGGGDVFRCLQFDCDLIEPPPRWLDGGDLRALYFSLPAYDFCEIAVFGA